MPCFRCSTRQTDPARGASPWRRAVVGGSQVLVCPACQAVGVDEQLDRCAACGSARLAKSLGELMCRACGRSGSEVGYTPTSDPETRDDVDGGSSDGVGRSADLSAEVAAAIARTFGRRAEMDGERPNVD